MSHNNDMQALVGRTERLVSAISDAILSAAEAAAERVELAAEVARVQQRLAAFGAVVETIAAQKRVLVERLATAEGPARALLERQIELLGLQELAVLERAGGATGDRATRPRGGGLGIGSTTGQRRQDVPTRR